MPDDWIVALGHLDYTKYNRCIIKYYHGQCSYPGFREKSSKMTSHFLANYSVTSIRGLFTFLVLRANEHLVIAVAARIQIRHEVEDLLAIERVDQTFRHHGDL